MLTNTKKLLSLSISTALLLGTVTNVSALLPPKYLSIKDFKLCLATKNMGTWCALCMPATKPAACPNESWQQLKSLAGKDKLPSC